MDEKVFNECKDLMRPVRKALKNIDVKGSNISEKDQIEKIKKHLLEIGDKISDCLIKYSDPDKIKLWRNYLWIFVSKFTTWSAERLKNVYKKLSKSRNAKLNTSTSLLLKSQDERDFKKSIDLSHSRSNMKNEFHCINSNIGYSKKFINNDSWKKEKPNENNEYTQAGWYSSSNKFNKLGSSSRLQNNHQLYKEEPSKYSRSNIKQETASNNLYNKSYSQQLNKNININDFEDWGTHSHEKKYSTQSKNNLLNSEQNDEKEVFSFYKLCHNKKINTMPFQEHDSVKETRKTKIDSYTENQNSLFRKNKSIKWPQSACHFLEDSMKCAKNNYNQANNHKSQVSKLTKYDDDANFQ